MSGQRSEFVNIVAFSVDILSLGNPSLFQSAEGSRRRPV